MDGRFRDPVDLARTSAGVGALVWGLSLVVVGPGTVDALILLAALVHVPLAVSVIPGASVEAAGPSFEATGSATPDVVASPQYGRFYRHVVFAQPIGALGLVGAVAVGPGTLGAALTVPWLATIGLLALYGLDRFRRRGPAPVHETLVDAGMGYAIVGAGSYLFHFLGIDLGFPPAIIHLTAAHFHYAGLLLPVVTGLAGRVVEDGLARQAYTVGAVTVLGGMGLVAAGITLSRLADLQVAEFVGATLFAAGVLVLAVVLLGIALVPGRVGTTSPGIASRALLGVAALSVTVTMVMAAGYGYSRAFDPGLLTIGTMVRFHGVTNALGFALPGLLAWSLAGNRNSQSGT